MKILAKILSKSYNKKFNKSVVDIGLLFKLEFRQDFHQDFRQDFFPIELGPRLALAAVEGDTSVQIVINFGARLAESGDAQPTAERLVTHPFCSRERH